MAEITKTLSDIQNKVLETIDSVQAPVVDVVKQAADRLDEVLPENRPELPDAVPAPAELVDLYFGFAQKLLDDQREFVKALLDAVSPLVPAHAKPVKVTKPKAAATAA
jgi:hypothetical protein